MKAFMLFFGVLLLALPARAEEPKPHPWSITVGSAWARLGPSQHPTGGLTIRAAGTRTWRISEAAWLDLGAELSVSGPDGGMRWVGILGGPLASVRGKPWRLPVEIAWGVNLDAGRLPVQTAWGLPMNYSGVYPGARAAIRYVPSDNVSVELYGKLIYVNTFSYDGAGGFTGLSSVGRF